LPQVESFSPATGSGRPLWRSTFYLFFPSKEALYAEVLLSVIPDMVKSLLERSFGVTDDVREALFLYQKELVRLIEGDELVRAITTDRSSWENLLSVDWSEFRRRGFEGDEGHPQARLAEPMAASAEDRPYDRHRRLRELLRDRGVGRNRRLDKDHDVRSGVLRPRGHQGLFRRLPGRPCPELGLSPEALDHALEETGKVPRAKAAPRLSFFGMLRSAYGAVGVEIRGVDPTREPKVTKLHERIVEGRWLSGSGEILLGERLARELDVRLGERVVIIAHSWARWIHRLYPHRGRPRHLRLPRGHGDRRAPSFRLPPGGGRKAAGVPGRGVRGAGLLRPEPHDPRLRADLLDRAHPLDRHFGAAFRLRSGEHSAFLGAGADAGAWGDGSTGDVSKPAVLYSSVSGWYWLGSLSVVATTGLIAAWYPARRAARLSPVQAIREG